nr:hypothetical protein GCM10025699_77530 [Microbacterium flavescens]
MLLDSVDGGPAKNVILLIGDGMGDSEITSARNYAYGAGGQLPGIDALPLTGQYTTYSLYKDGPNKGKPDYVPDSAATGSAWATGTKTYDNAISVDVDGVPQDTLLEIAKANGKKTGNVSTAELQDATPAVQSAHVAARSCYGPDTVTQCRADALDQGGLGSISEQIIGTRADLTLGGGAASFEQTARAGQWQGESLFDQAADRGYQVVRDAAGLDALASADQSEPVLGTFTDGNFPTRFAATTATVGGADLAPQTCQPNPDRLSTDLSLRSLTEKSIDLLDDDNGFFLQVEGASIDKRDHSADACGQIGEVLDLDEAVQAALDFASRRRHHGDRDGRPRPHEPDRRLDAARHAQHRADHGGRHHDEDRLRHGRGRRLAAAHRLAAARRGLRSGGRERRRTDRSDRQLLHHRERPPARPRPRRTELRRDPLGPVEVAPEAEFDVTASGLAGDRQVSAVLDADGAAAAVDLGPVDVIDGVATVTVQAPAEPGPFTVTLTGAQSGVELVAPVSVVEAPSSRRRRPARCPSTRRRTRRHPRAPCPGAVTPPAAPARAPWPSPVRRRCPAGPRADARRLGRRARAASPASARRDG